MIAIAILAALLALPDGWGMIIIVLSIPCLTAVGAHWLALRGQRRLAAIGFWGLATLTNVLYAAACIAPGLLELMLLFLGWLFIFLPMIASLGLAWTTLSNREGAVPQAPRPAVGFSVVVLAMLPVLTLCTLWPLHLAFLIGRPTLERLADQVAAGQTVGFPRQSGLFRLLGSAVDPVSGSVGLMIDPNPGGPTGFVRVRPGTPLDRRGPIIGSDLNVDLGGGWWYRDDD